MVLFLCVWVCLRLLLGCGCGGFDAGFGVWNVEKALKGNLANKGRRN
jgi:hypothetical protein